MLVFAAAKALGQRPNEVREWDDDELYGLVAYGQLEAEAVKDKEKEATAGAALPSPSQARPIAHQATRSVIYRVGPRPSKPKG
ncbi:hypothetical protein [Comamonas sp. JC664]|uniref:hypothetical protein n=1 Tax=Comamonas sp. JC664 TaxID=2801917 RepID=UPI00174DD83C|nr:hypothetical protein [Comamonas sp. JC664]MBL0698935.1 hypothetical protein [Comamonas sp. JC664]GHG79639.1 hypothetical protein GCM10012319_31700 [Comamonas sp. KCTC 72670]